MTRILPALVGCALLLAGPAAHAVRPFITDDARVVGADLAQLETWIRGDARSLQHWAIVAFGPWSPVELSIGAVHGAGYEDGPARYSIAGPLLQLKVLLLEPKPNRWPGVALSIGTTAPAGHGAFRAPAWERFAYLALTESLFDRERLLVHANLGMGMVDGTHGEASQISYTWGVGAQLRLVAGLHLVAEVVSGDPYEPGAGGIGQAGLRYILNGRVQLDATFGGGLWGEEPMPMWGTAGVRFVSSPLGRAKKD